jgi:hypothetical protein
MPHRQCLDKRLPLARAGRGELEMASQSQHSVNIKVAACMLFFEKKQRIILASNNHDHWLQERRSQEIPLCRARHLS